jgi:tetratricopeptide (TPR) repeat protein
MIKKGFSTHIQPLLRVGFAGLLIGFSTLLNAPAAMSQPSNGASSHLTSFASSHSLKPATSHSTGFASSPTSEISKTVTTPASQRTDSLKADSLFRIAKEHFEQQNFNSAQQFVSAAIELDGNQADYWKLLMHIQHGQGDVEGTVKILARLIELEPKERQHYLDRAFLLAYLGEYDESLALYDELVQKLGKDDQVYTAIATVYKMQGEEAKAQAELEALIEKGTDKSTAYGMLGELFFEEGKLDEALNMYDAGLARFKDDPLLLFGKADVLKAKNQVSQAFALLEKGFQNPQVDVDYKTSLLYKSMEERVYDAQKLLTLADRFVYDYPADPRSHAVRGDLYGQMQNFSEARISYLKALEINRYIPGIWMQLIYLSFMREDWKEAQQTGRRAAELFPNDPELLFYTGNAFLMDKNNAEARTYFEAALNNTPQNNTDLLGDIYASLGGVYYALEMYAASDVAYQEALAIDSLDALALNNYAYYLAERNEKLEQAKSMAKKSIELNPNNSNNQDTYAWILYKLGEYKEALKWIKSAIKYDLRGPSPVLLEHYGDILYKNGKIRSAVSQWKNALKVTDGSDEDAVRLSQKIKEKRIVDE